MKISLFHYVVMALKLTSSLTKGDIAVISPFDLYQKITLYLIMIAPFKMSISKGAIVTNSYLTTILTLVPSGYFST